MLLVAITASTTVPGASRPRTPSARALPPDDLYGPRMRFHSAVVNAVRRSAINAGYEPHLPGIVRRSEIRRFLPKRPVVVEAGAHTGTDTVAMATAWRDATIYALEPVPHIYEQLASRTKPHENVVAQRVALAATTGMLTMHVSSGASDGSSSLLAPADHLIHHPDVLFTETIQVPTVTLDDWAARQGIGRVDLLWLDAQGAELSILKAGTTVLESVSAAYLEVSLTQTYVGAPLYEEVRAWMDERDFEVRLERLPWADMGNVLFVRR